MVPYEPAHQLLAFIIVQIDDKNPMRFHKFPGACEGLRFSNNNFLNPKLDNRSGAKITGHQCGIKNSPAVSANSSGITEAINFRMHYWIIILNAPVISSADDPPVLHKDRTNWNSALI